MRFLIALLLVTTNVHAAYNVCECTTKKNFLGYATTTDCKRTQKVELIVILPCTPGQKTQMVKPELILHPVPDTSPPPVAPKTAAPMPTRVPWWEQ